MRGDLWATPPPAVSSFPGAAPLPTPLSPGVEKVVPATRGLRGRLLVPGYQQALEDWISTSSCVVIQETCLTSLSSLMGDDWSGWDSFERPFLEGLPFTVYLLHC